MSLRAFLDRLNLPQRRIIACVGIVLFLAAYVWGVTAIGGYLPDNPVVQIIYYGVTGILWGIPVLPLISWSENYRRKEKKK